MMETLMMFATLYVSIQFNRTKESKDRQNVTLKKALLYQQYYKDKLCFIYIHHKPVIFVLQP